MCPAPPDGCRATQHLVENLFWENVYKKAMGLIDSDKAFRPRKASKVEKPSSRGASSLHRWSLMLLPVLWLMPLRSLHTCKCVYYSVSTQLCVAAIMLLLPGAGTNDSDRPLGLIAVTP